MNWADSMVTYSYSLYSWLRSGRMKFTVKPSLFLQLLQLCSFDANYQKSIAMVEPINKRLKLDEEQSGSPLGGSPLGGSPFRESSPDVSAIRTLQMNELIDDLYKVVYEIHNGSDELINTVKVSPDKKTLAFCTSRAKIHIYDFEKGTKISELTGHTKGINDIDFSPINSDILASASDDLTIRLWSLSKGKCIKILKKHTYHVTTLKFTNKGNILISASADETITIWDLSSGKTLKTLAAHSDPILSICLSPDNSIIFSGSYDGVMRLFDCETGQCLKTLVFNSSSYGTATASTNDVVNPPISNVECSPNGKYLLSSSLDGAIRLWDYMNNKVLKTYSGEDNKVISEKYNCSSRFITCTKDALVVSGSDNGELDFWNVQSKKLISNQVEVTGPLLGIESINGGQTLVVCGMNGVLKVLAINEKYV